MNMNRVRQHWSCSCSDSWALIDRLNPDEAYERGLISQEERNAIVDTFVREISIAFEVKGFVSCEDVHQTPKSEIVRRFRKGLGQTKPEPGCE
jgi:hypothetical protein